MSREEFGAATTRPVPPQILRLRRAFGTGTPLGPGPTLDPRTAPDGADAGGDPPGAGPPRRGRPARRRAALGAGAPLATGLGALLGRGGVQAWDSAPVPVADTDGQVAWAVVSQATSLPGTAAADRLSLAVRVTNLAREPLVVDGAQGTFDAATVTSVTPVGVAARPGGAVTVTVTVTVTCRSPRPLRVPPLQVRRAGHLRDAVELQGAGDALARVCSAGDARRAVVVVRSAQTDGDRLRLALAAPTGRTTKVVGARIGDVRLTGRMPIFLDAMDTVLWLDRPRECPPQWSAGGLPRDLVLDLDAGAPAQLSVDVGPELSRWLLAGPCTASVPAPALSPAPSGSPS